MAVGRNTGIIMHHSKNVCGNSNQPTGWKNGEKKSEEKNWMN